MDLKYLKSNSEKGFTLMELIVVITIIIILSTVLFANYRGLQYNLALQRASYRLLHDVRRAQVMAGTPHACTITHRDVYSYGIYLKTNTNDKYYLFADCDEDGTYGFSKDEIIETISFEKGIILNTIKTYSGLLATSQTSAVALFIPPDPFTSIRPGGSSGIGADSVNFELKISSVASPVKTLIINKSGMIDIE